MYKVLVAFGLFTIVSMTITSTCANASSIAVLEPSPPRFFDLNGDRLRIVKESEQVQIVTTFRNALEERVDFVGLIEVRDQTGVTVFLSWQSNVVEPLGNKTIGVSWLVQNSTSYQSRTFAITNFENPLVLSPVESHDIDAPIIESISH